MSLLEIKDLTKSYEDGKVVLTKINLKLDSNKIVSVIGKSGEGKTTLLKVINMLATFDEGQVIIDGLKMNESKETNQLIQKEIGLVFQDYNLFPHLTVLENLNLALIKVLKMNKEEATKKSLEMLKKVGIADKQNFYPQALSGGQMQRVAIARALVLEPKILCFDEPTSALDPILTEEVASLIKNLKNENRLIFVVTHDMKLAREISDEVVYIQDGQIIEHLNIADASNSNNEEFKNFFLN